jgi:phosphoribosyl-ATP pyrophosphohydrolase
MTTTMKQTFENMFTDFAAFSLTAYPNATSLISLSKLEKEADEVRQEIEKGNKGPELAIEFADCLFCLIHSMAQEGVSVEELRAAFEKKLAINKARKWSQNPDGTYSHIKEHVIQDPVH